MYLTHGSVLQYFQINIPNWIAISTLINMDLDSKRIENALQKCINHKDRWLVIYEHDNGPAKGHLSTKNYNMQGINNRIFLEKFTKTKSSSLPTMSYQTNFHKLGRRTLKHVIILIALSHSCIDFVGPIKPTMR